MTKRLSICACSALKIMMFIVCCIYSFSTHAQTVVGKWKMTAVKETVTDKATGKTQDLTAQIGNITKMMEQVIELSADNTYNMTNKMIGEKKGLQVTGKYSVAGNQLKLQPGKSNMVVDTKPASPVNTNLPNTVTIVSNTANTLVLRYGATTTDDGKTFTVDIIDTFTKQ